MIPVLLVGYKRVFELTELLRRSLEIGATRVYVAIDASDTAGKNSITSLFKSKIDEIARDFPDSEVKVWFRETNLGSSLSVLSAVEWAFQFEESLVILEDDLDISPDLFSYFGSLIGILDADPKILMISGSNPFRGKSQNELSGYSHYPVVWGWATTRIKWEIMKDGIFQFDYLFEKPIKIRVRNFLETGRTRALSRLIDAWDVPLAAFMRAHRYKCLIPNLNLVSNTGYDISATHTTVQKWPLGVEIEQVKTIESGFHQNYDAQMESLVLGIKLRHTLSKIKLKLNNFVKDSKIQNSLLLKDFKSIEIPVNGEGK
jgi:hypothetical protein